MAMTDADARKLLASWLIALEAERMSPHTLKGYRTAVTQLLDWLSAQGLEADFSDPAGVRAWLASLADAGRQGGTMQVKLAGIRSFAKWLLEEQELTESGVHRVAWPKVDERAPAALTAAQVAALIRTCDRGIFTGVRDEAIISLMADSLLRADELLSITTGGDIDLRERTVHVRRGKGGRERWSAFSAQTARRLDRYERWRSRHRAAGLDAYWLAKGRGPLTYAALYSTFSRRGDRVGIDVHPHMTRAGGAIGWRRRGGSTESLMTIAGWKDLKMVMRYTRAAEQQLALEEAKRLLDHP